MPQSFNRSEDIAKLHKNRIMSAFINQGEWELHASVKEKFSVPLEIWTNWPEAQKEKHFNNFCSYKGPNRQPPKPYVDKDGIYEVPANYTHVAKKPEQRTRVRATRCGPKSGRAQNRKNFTSNLDDMALQELLQLRQKARDLKNSNAQTTSSVEDDIAPSGTGTTNSSAEITDVENATNINTNTTGGPQIVGNTNENAATTGPTVAEIVAMKLPQLRALCKQRKLKSSGNKPDLIALLINGK